MHPHTHEPSPIRESRIVTQLRNLYRIVRGPDALLGEVPGAVLRIFLGPQPTRTIWGKPFTVDLRDVAGVDMFLRAKYEPAESAIMLALLPVGTRAVDLGAHIGYHTVQFAEAVGIDGRVLAVAPDPTNYNLLCRNVRDRGLEDIVQTVRGAAGDGDYVGDLFKSSTMNHGDNRMYRSTDGKGGEILSVDVHAVDGLVGGWERVDFVKMDIQGFECRALAGMRNTLQKNESLLIVTEYWPQGLTWPVPTRARSCTICRTRDLRFGSSLKGRPALRDAGRSLGAHDDLNQRNQRRLRTRLHGFGSSPLDRPLCRCRTTALAGKRLSPRCAQRCRTSSSPSQAVQSSRSRFRRTY